MPQFAVERLVAVDPVGEPLVQVAFRAGDDGRSAAAAITASGRLVVMVAEQQQGLLGPGERKARQYELTADFDGKATQVLLDGRIRQLLVGTDRGTGVRVAAEWSGASAGVCGAHCRLRGRSLGVGVRAG